MCNILSLSLSLSLSLHNLNLWNMEVNLNTFTFILKTAQQTTSYTCWHKRPGAGTIAVRQILMHNSLHTNCWRKVSRTQSTLTYPSLKEMIYADWDLKSTQLANICHSRNSTGICHYPITCLLACLQVLPLNVVTQIGILTLLILGHLKW